MKKLRRRYNRAFKISVVTELEGGKSPVQIAREQGIHPSLPSRWRDKYAENPEKAFGGNGVFADSILTPLKKESLPLQVY
jgi:transposase